MQSFWAGQAIPPYPARIHPALSSFADECCGTLARLVVYVGALALLAIVGIHFWDQLPLGMAAGPAVRPAWSPALRSYPAFAVSQTDSHEKTESYEIFRHPEGGRKDVLRWGAPGEKPVAELEIYRPGGEWNPSTSAAAEIARRMDQGGGHELEAAGIIDSKFGPVTLLRLLDGADGAHSCLGFVRRLDEANLQISGWSCQGDTLPARRAAIGCTLDRLTLLTAGNEPRLAEIFARAELKRGSCAAAATSAPSVDWVTRAENPRLRGPL
jgi:hypothetical protein